MSDTGELIRGVALSIGGIALAHSMVATVSKMTPRRIPKASSVIDPLKGQSKRRQMKPGKSKIGDRLTTQSLVEKECEVSKKKFALASAALEMLIIFFRGRRATATSVGDQTALGTPLASGQLKTNSMYMAQNKQRRLSRAWSRHRGILWLQLWKEFVVGFRGFWPYGREILSTGF